MIMTTWARNVSDIATDVISTNPNLSFHPDVAVQFEIVPDNVSDGWIYSNGSWNEPVVPAPIQRYETSITRQQFFMLFTLQERIDIRSSSDAGVHDFLDILMDMSNSVPPVIIDVTSQEVIDAINYLSTVSVPASSPARKLIASGRVSTILLGRPI